MTIYSEQAHRVQTAIEFNPDKTSQEPKHLRVGLDLSKADMLGLVKLLIEKEVFTLEEYIDAINDSVTAEADMQEKALQEALDVTNLKTS